ncbi:hypothetical protein [Streptomyces sp. NBC_01563]|uniref:hypothetical protein n=1 Tax=Streptomyces sp. NBC_01563 TaxID=2975880 RepID=UPI00386A29DB
MNTDRRPLGTGPTRADLSRTRDIEPPAPRALLAAERLPLVQAAAEPPPARPDGRRTLGSRPAPA